MQLTQRDQKLLLVLASVLLLTGAYVFGYKNYGERRAEYDKKVSELQVKYDDLNMKNSKRQQYLEKTETNQAEAKAIIARYPSSLKNENALYFTSQLEEATGVHVSQLSYLDPVSFYVGKEDTEGKKPEGIKSTSTITLETDYIQLKKLLAFIYKGDQRRVIQQITLSRDVKGGALGGTIAYDTYSYNGYGTEDENVQIPMGQAGQGLPQLFGDLASK